MPSFPESGVAYQRAWEMCRLSAAPKPRGETPLPETLLLDWLGAYNAL